jgi:predicted amidophosphoribosyltransferase
VPCGKPMENLLNTLFPPKCLFCKSTKGTVFCSECLKKCQVLENNIYFIYLKKLGKRLEVFSPFDYDGYVRQCIKYAKYGGRQFTSLKILSVYGVNFTFNLNHSMEGFEIVPIPLNKRKYRSRGFNQAEVIAKILAENTSCG